MLFSIVWGHILKQFAWGAIFSVSVQMHVAGMIGQNFSGEGGGVLQDLGVAWDKFCRGIRHQHAL